MSRLLKKTADDIMEQESMEEVPANNTSYDVVKNLLERISSGSEDIKANYYSLLENLNALYAEYPGVYNELKVMVKLPNKNDVNNIARFKDDIDEAVRMLSDESFLSGIIK